MISLILLIHMIFILLWISISAHSSPYPNCIYQIATAEYPDHSFFVENFLNLTSFARSSEDQEMDAAVSHSLVTGDGSQITQIVEYQAISYIVLFLTCSAVIFIVILLRTNATYARSLTAFFGIDNIKALHPCAIFVNLLCLIFLLLLTFRFPYIQASLDKIQCAKQYLKEATLQGKGEWGGVNYIISSMESQIDMLEAIQQMPSIYQTNTSSIARRLQNQSLFVSNLLQLYQDSTVQVDDQIITYQVLLPNLFESQELLTELNESINSVVELGRTTVLTEELLADLSIAAENQRISLENNILSLRMGQEDLSKADIWEYQLKKMMEIPYTSLIQIFIRVLTQFGAQIVFVNTVFLILLVKFREPLFVKCVNFLWMLLLLLTLMPIAMAFYLASVEHVTLSYCSVMGQIQSNQSSYQNLEAYDHTFQLFESCFYGDGEFGSLSPLSISSGILQSAIGNLSLFVKQNQLGSNRRHSDSFIFKEDIAVIQNYIQAQQYNWESKWGYLTDLRTQLNHWTLNDGSGEHCYRHKWVFSVDDCLQSEAAVPSSFSNQFRTSSTSVLCVPLSWMDSTGQPHLITYSQLISNYVGDRTVCPVAVSEIDRVATLLTNGLQAKFDSLQSLRDHIQSEYQELRLLLRMVRAKYPVKQDQYKYLVTFGEPTHDITPSLQSKFNAALNSKASCSSLKTWVSKLYTEACQNLRPAAVESNLLNLVVLLLLSLVGLVGMLRGLSDEAQMIWEIQMFEEYEDIRSASSRSNVHKAEIYNRHFFRNKKD